MPDVPIAGPRRARALQQEPGLATRVEVPPDADSAPTVQYVRNSEIPTLPKHPATRPLPPLDYDETGRGRRPRALELTQPGRKRRRMRGVRWFVLGLAFGALGAVFVRGDAPGTLRSLRFWGADVLRALEHAPAPGSGIAPPARALAMGTASHAPPAQKFEPCPVNPAPDDPCAALLAPFANDRGMTQGASAPLAMNVPTVSVDDLPRAKPTVVARRHRPAGPSTSSTTAAPQGSDDDGAADPGGVDPYADDPQSSPTKASPPPGHDDKPASDAPPAQEPSARNEAP
jgi:hypothetical protein